MSEWNVRGARVVLDATELCRDWLLAGAEFDLLQRGSRMAGLMPTVPEFVLTEAIAHHGRASKAAQRDSKKLTLSLRRLLGHGVDLPDPLLEFDYDQVLRDRIQEIGGQVVDTPAVPHRVIVERAVSRTPPFDERGSGYRDTLTWFVCLDLARRGDSVFLVSSDKDFARGESLHPDLADEVAGLSGSVTLVRHLGDWLTEISPWRGASNYREAGRLSKRTPEPTAETRLEPGDADWQRWAEIDAQVTEAWAPWDMFEAELFQAEELGLPPSADIEGVTYHGSGPLEDGTVTVGDDGVERLLYRFHIEFEVEMRLRFDLAMEAGFMERTLGPADRMERLQTVVAMTGVLAVIPDETDPDFPWNTDYIQFSPEVDLGGLGRLREDPDQLLLPLDEF